MKAVGFTSPGLVESLHLAQRQIPSLKEGECLVKVFYSALNRADTLQRRGLYPVPPGATDILGLEATGVVVKEASSNDRLWKKNDKVMALLPGYSLEFIFYFIMLFIIFITLKIGGGNAEYDKKFI